MLERPNLKDTRRTFLSAVCEDLVVGDCGCFEIAVSNNPSRPIFLFPTDGLTMNIVMSDKTYGYAQRVSLDAVELPENYMSGYITTTPVFYPRNDIAPALLPRFLIAKVGQIAAHDAMKMCKEVYLCVRPCKRGLWAVSMYYATAGMLYNITSYADRALQFPAVSSGRVIVDNVATL